MVVIGTSDFESKNNLFVLIQIIKKITKLFFKYNLIPSIIIGEWSTIDSLSVAETVISSISSISSAICDCVNLPINMY